MLVSIVTVIKTAFPAALGCQKGLSVHHAAHSVVKVTNCVIISVL